MALASKVELTLPVFPGAIGSLVQSATVQPQEVVTLDTVSYTHLLSWATAYYAHSLAACIVKENPRIKQVFDSWKAQGLSLIHIFYLGDGRKIQTYPDEREYVSGCVSLLI